MTEHELLSLFDRDILELGEQADRVKRERFGTAVFVLERYLSRDGTFPEKGGELQCRSVYLDMEGLEAGEAVRRIEALRLSGFCGTISGPTASHLWRWAGESWMNVKAWLRTMKEAGLSLLRGDDAELLDDRWRARRGEGLVPVDIWFGIHRCAHEAGLPSSASVRYGAQESLEDRARHLSLLGALQRESGGLVAVRIEPWDPERWPLPEHLDLAPTTGLDDLRMVAVCRLALPEIHVEVSWRMWDDKLAQTALGFGADALSGAFPRRWFESLSCSGSELGDRKEIARMVRETALDPVWVDELFRPDPKEAGVS
ncbi:MAG: hypothetical protein IRY98_02110 [Alicyclobacillaceae bacterium]|nr:hypothetical protein [Alicyclobacillaceae bacterium]